MDISAHAENFYAAITAKFPEQDPFGFGRNINVFSVEPGRFYDRIVRDQSVYAFIDRSTGEVCKAAGYNRVSKRADGTTFGKYFCSDPESLEFVIRNADEHGSFLYDSFIPA